MVRLKYLLTLAVLLMLAAGCAHRGEDSAQDDDAKIKKAQKALEKEYNNPKTHTYLGVLYEKKGLIAQAEKHYRIAMEFDPHFIESYLDLGNLYLKEKDFPGAIQTIQKALEFAPQDTQIHYLLATIFKETKQYQEALGEYQKVLEKDPKYVLAQNFTGMIYYELKDFGKAEEAFQKSLTLDPAGADAYGNLGILYDFNLHDPKKAVTYYEKFLELRSEGENVALLRDLLSKAKAEVEKTEQAQESTRKKQEEPGKNQKLFEEGKSLYQEGRYEEAEVKLENFLKQKSDDREGNIYFALSKSRTSPPAEAIKILQDTIHNIKDSAELWDALANLYDQENSPKTLETYEEALRLFPEDSHAKSFRERIESLKEQASIASDAGPSRTLAPVIIEKPPVILKEPPAAKENLQPLKEPALTTPPKKNPKIQKQSIVHFNQGTSYQSKGQHVHAIEEYQKALLLDSSNIKAHYNLGILYKWKGEYDKAIREYNAVIKLDPSFAKAYYNLGVLLKSQGHLDEAEGKFKRAIQADARYSEAYLGLGIIYSQNKKNIKQAAIYYKKYLQLNPQAPTAGKIKVWLHATGEDG